MLRNYNILNAVRIRLYNNNNNSNTYKNNRDSCRACIVGIYYTAAITNNNYPRSMSLLK